MAKNINYLIVGRSIQAKKRALEEKKTVSGLRAAIADTGNRVALVLGREIRSRVKKDPEKFESDQKAEVTLRRELQVAIWSELLTEFETVIGKPPTEAELTAVEKFETTALDEGTWKTAVLEHRHIVKFGERSCEGCGNALDLFDRVTWKHPHGEKAWHEKCRPAGAEIDRKGAIVFEMAQRHVDKHGERNCKRCGELVKIGDLVAWKRGSRDIAHERCGL